MKYIKYKENAAINVGDSLRGTVRCMMKNGALIDVVSDVTGKTFSVFSSWPGFLEAGTQVLCYIKGYRNKGRDIIGEIDSILYDEALGMAA